MELKVGGFSSAVKLEKEGEKRKTICGSTNYLSPEMANKKGYSYEVDIWSLGIILYTLLIGKTPFEDKDDQLIIKKIKLNSYSFPNNVIISENAKNLISKILILDPKKRPSIDQIIIHDFFTQEPIPKLLPTSTLIHPPNLSYVKEIKSDDNNDINNNENKISNNLKGPEIWVKKWLDFSSKYGLGYILNNGFCGVHFNDNSKMVLNPVTNNFLYIQKNEIDKEEKINSFNINNYPNELKKKIIILNHFKNYLEPESNKNSIQENKINDKEVNDKPFIYLKKWMRTKHAIMFRLSNKIVQVIFNDKTVIILSSECKTVTYCNKKGERSIYPLGIALQADNQEMVKRYKYTKDILKHMLAVNEAKIKKKAEQNLANDNSDNINDNKEKEIKIIFSSCDQLILDVSISCKTSDNFSDVMNLLFKKYPDFANRQIEFLVNGDRVLIDKTIKENKIRDNDHIVMVEFNFD